MSTFQRISGDQLKSHQLSLQCYLDTSKDVRINPRQYEDLTELIDLFGLMDLDQPARSSSIPSQFTVSSSIPSLIIVDDEVGITEMLEKNLLAWEYPADAIHTFQSGESAILHAARHTVEIAFVDMKLVNPWATRGAYVSGLEVVRRIKERYPRARVILISGFGTYAIVREAILELGASYYLGKPFLPADFLMLTQWGVEKLQR